MKTDGGPAFPVSADEMADWKRPEDAWSTNEDQFIVSTGMSLRDWFAGKALSAILSREDGYDPLAAAKWAYRYADAMIAERNLP